MATSAKDQQQQSTIDASAIGIANDDNQTTKEAPNPMITNDNTTTEVSDGPAPPTRSDMGANASASANDTTTSDDTAASAEEPKPKVNDDIISVIDNSGISTRLVALMLSPDRPRLTDDKVLHNLIQRLKLQDNYKKDKALQDNLRHLALDDNEANSTVM